MIQEPVELFAFVAQVVLKMHTDWSPGGGGQKGHSAEAICFGRRWGLRVPIFRLDSSRRITPNGWARGGAGVRWWHTWHGVAAHI